MTFTLMPIVEGDGEVQAIPILLRRICGELFNRYDIMVRSPWRVPRSKIVKAHEIDRVYTALARGAEGGRGAVIVILDQDDDTDLAELRSVVATPMAAKAPIEVVVASREYEAWFLGAVESLRSHRSVRNDAHFDGDPEAPRNAKGRLEAVMLESYRETIHQSAFSDVMNLHDARNRCPSFAYLVDAVGRLLP